MESPEFCNLHGNELFVVSNEYKNSQKFYANHKIIRYVAYTSANAQLSMRQILYQHLKTVCIGAVKGERITCLQKSQHRSFWWTCTAWMRPCAIT